MRGGHTLGVEIGAAPHPDPLVMAKPCSAWTYARGERADAEHESRIVSPSFLITGPSDAAVRFLCAHGAGAGMETPFLKSIAELLAERGVVTYRFEFAYMAARRQGARKPPPKAERLMDEYRAAVAAVPAGAPLIIGGKSMGGRVASLVADELYAAGRIVGLACLGYPFHPPKKPEQLRTAHLTALACPALIVQGERDPFGGRAEVEGYGLSPAIRLHWADRRRPRPGPARRLGLHPQGQPHRRRRRGRGLVSDPPGLTPLLQQTSCPGVRPGGSDTTATPARAGRGAGAAAASARRRG